jgi:hypothetical protein
MTLTEQIKLVAELRKKHTEMVEKKKQMYDEFISQHVEYFGDVVTAETKMKEAETKLREMTIEAYNETGDKQPAYGVGVKVIKILDYDIKEAYEWAIRHNMATILDVKNFEKVAKASPLEFVTYGEKLTATIATDLSKYLE